MTLPQPLQDTLNAMGTLPYQNTLNPLSGQHRASGYHLHPENIRLSRRTLNMNRCLTTPNFLSRLSVGITAGYVGPGQDGIIYRSDQ